MSAFLTVKSADGRVIAAGDQVETLEGDKVRSRVTFRFGNGSIDDETAVFTQTSVFRLVTDHHIQRGPSFAKALEVWLNVPERTVRWRESKGGKETTGTQRMDLPADLANGMTSLIVENFPKHQLEMKTSYLAIASKPRIITLSVKPEGEDIFEIGGDKRHAKRFRIHIDLGGLTGIIAPLIGKQPSDIQMWTTEGEIPIFLKMVGPLYSGGPIWTTEIAAPVWPKKAK